MVMISVFLKELNEFTAIVAGDSLRTSAFEILSGKDLDDL